MQAISRIYFLKISLSLLLLTCAVITGFTQEKYQVRMSMMGNSITQGARLSDPANESYSAQLGQMFSAVYGDTVDILNAGVSGRTMMRDPENILSFDPLVPLWNEPVFEKALTYVPDICLIMLGTNDAKPYIWNELGDQFLSECAAMVDTFKARNPNTKFIICKPPPIWDGQIYGTSFDDLHNDSILVNYVFPALETVAEQNNALLVDFHSLFSDPGDTIYFPDKLHPNAEGHQMMAELLYNEIMGVDLIDQVETGLAYVSTFEQAVSPVLDGSTVELQWTTIFADSVFLDGEYVDTNGSTEVVAEAGKVYTLTAQGPNNSADFTLTLQTYTPEKTGLVISTLSDDYKEGGPVVLNVDYTDQYNRVMAENTSNVTWTITDGEGRFGEQSDTSIVFIPSTIGRVIIQATEGDLSDDIGLRVTSLTKLLNVVDAGEIKVFPNPVGNTLSLKVDNLNRSKGQIRVFNLWGEEVLKYDINLIGQGKTTLDLDASSLKGGVYVFGIYLDNETRYGKFIKTGY